MRRYWTWYGWERSFYHGLLVLTNSAGLGSFFHSSMLRGQGPIAVEREHSVRAVRGWEEERWIHHLAAYLGYVRIPHLRGCAGLHHINASKRRSSRLAGKACILWNTSCLWILSNAIFFLCFADLTN